MGQNSKLTSAVLSGPMRRLGMRDSEFAFLDNKNEQRLRQIREGEVIQVNIGWYSVLVCSDGQNYVCFQGAQNVTYGFGYSDANILREGDIVYFTITDSSNQNGMILAKKPTLLSVDNTHPMKVHSETDQERRTHFFSDDCYSKTQSAYTTAPSNVKDNSVRQYTNTRPTDLVSGEYAMLNQHRCGLIGGLYSMSMVGGGAHVRIFSLENRIRIVADSIRQCTMCGNDNEWHNRRYLSHERIGCLYQEERLGLKSKGQSAFTKHDYHAKDGYFTKDKEEKQIARPRILEQEGYYGNLSTRYCLRPDPDTGDPRTLEQEPKDVGVARESIDPSGQYRLAVTGMLGFERIGRIPVPFRKAYPWQKEAKEPKAEALKEFKHDEGHPYYRQLELADRVAYDLKNSYARTDESDTEFKVPEESELSGKLKDVYDQGFTDSTTVKLEKYDKRRSGMWYGEDGSVIIRDAWGSEIVMIGGNIQLSCAGNVEIMPGKSALTLAGDDAIVKAQNSVDIEAADKDVRVNGYNNVQILAGIPDVHKGGVTIEAAETASPWDAESVEGGEDLKTSGIFLKSKKGTIATDAKYVVLRSRKITSVLSGEEDLENGQILMSAKKGIYSYGKNVISVSDEAVMLVADDFAGIGGNSALVDGAEGAMILSRNDVPAIWVSIDRSTYLKDIAVILSNILKNEMIVALGYTMDKLEKMFFKFRNSQQCYTDHPWELGSSGNFTLYQAFWLQVQSKFETLSSASPKNFEDHKGEWQGSPAKNPWPGTEAVSSGKYAKLASGSPVNMGDGGMNKSRKSVQDSSPVTETALFPGYQIRS